jgi:5-methylcytosine-specific restriction endonuclease McrA
MTGRPSKLIDATMGDFSHKEEGIYVEFYGPEKDELPVSPKMVHLVTNFGKCATCGATITQLLKPCTCGTNYNLTEFYEHRHNPPYLVARLPNDLGNDLRKAIRDAAQIQKYQNRKKILSKSAKATKADLQGLWRAQEGGCLYCGGKLTTNISDPDEVYCHLDHVVAVSNGGTGSIENLAFSCPHCNMSKSARSYRSFVQHIDKQLSQDNLATAKRIRLQRSQYLASIKAT